MADASETQERTHKSERIAVRLTPATKRTLEHAADVTGRSLSDFVVDSALTAAQQAIDDHERLRLIGEDREIFLAALASPPEPNDALKAAAARRRQSSRG